MSVRITSSHFNKTTVVQIIVLAVIVKINISSSNTLTVSNLDAQCFRCLCMAAGECDMRARCEDGYCGPFQLGKDYWEEAGKITLHPGGAKNNEGFRNCTYDYECSKRVITKYFAKFGKDCNNDGVTDCEDYAMINYNGGYDCELNVSRNKPGREFIGRFNTCMAQH